MRIAGISVVFPSQIMNIEETTDLVRYYSKDTYQSSDKRGLKEAIDKIYNLLKRTGAKNRRIIGRREKAIDFIKEAIENALQEGNCSKNEVDCVIYAGVFVGFMEPANASLIAKLVGLNNAKCFDVAEACLGFVRGFDIAEYYLQKKYRNILIVSGEFLNSYDGYLLPCNYKLNYWEEIDWKFSSYTMGDVAAAVLLQAGDAGSPWNADWISMPQYADLCSIALPSCKRFVGDIEKVIGDGEHKSFVTFGRAMHIALKDKFLEIFHKNVIKMESIKMIFPHTSSKSYYEKLADMCKVADKMYYLYQEYGNMATASFPAGIYFAKKENLIMRGDTIAGWIGASGLSVAFCTMIY